VSLKWAVPQLQEQEACCGFYVYSAAVAADNVARPGLLLPCANDSAATQIPRCPVIPRVAQGSADDFFAALEVSAYIYECMCPLFVYFESTLSG
jgi:hypothetical protein